MKTVKILTLLSLLAGGNIVCASATIPQIAKATLACLGGSIGTYGVHKALTSDNPVVQPSVQVSQAPAPSRAQALLASAGQTALWAKDGVSRITPTFVKNIASGIARGVSTGLLRGKSQIKAHPKAAAVALLGTVFLGKTIYNFCYNVNKEVTVAVEDTVKQQKRSLSTRIKLSLPLLNRLYKDC